MSAMGVAHLLMGEAVISLGDLVAKLDPAVPAGPVKDRLVEIADRFLLLAAYWPRSRHRSSCVFCFVKRCSDRGAPDPSRRPVDPARCGLSPWIIPGGLVLRYGTL